MLNKSFEEMRKINVTPFLSERDGKDYLNWADAKRLLHDNGAEQVWFVPIENPRTGGSLFYTDIEFVSGERKNRCYETKVEIHIDDKVYYMTSPVMNGSNPVQDNSMTQQRVWNSMCRSFVKGVAIYTGLGFDLWCKSEHEESAAEEDLTRHSLAAIKRRVEELVTAKIQSGLSLEIICRELGMSEEEFRAQFAMYQTLHNFEKRIAQLKK